jgi:hypothetical protein
VVVFRSVDDEIVREAAGGAGVVAAGTSGDFGLAVALPFAFAAFKKGDAVRPMPGVPVREGGLLGRLIDGLSQELKKSSSPPAGVLEFVDSASSAASSITTLSGFLYASA